MKNLILIFAFLFASVSFASNGIKQTVILEKPLIVKGIKKNVKEKPECTVTCSVTIDGITYTTTAGNWFSSCEGATYRCLGKLLRAIQ